MVFMTKFTEKKLIRFDWAIKYILRDKANFVILEGFLSELLGEIITITKILESESNQSKKKDKFNRVDILVENSTGELLIIEIQNTLELDYLHRILYGTAKVITENIKLGEAYKNVKKVISISIVYFELGHGKDYIYKGITNFIGIHKKDELELSKGQKELFGNIKVEHIFPEYYLLKVNSFDDKTKNRLDEWIYFLKNESVKSNFKAKGLKEASDKLDVLKMTPKDRKKYQKYLEDLSTEASVADSLNIEMKLKLREEKEKLEQEFKIKLDEELKIKENELKIKEINSNKNLALELIKDKLPIEKIIKYTKLSKEEINQIIKDGEGEGRK